MYSDQERLQFIKSCQWVFIEVIGKLENTSHHCVEVVNAAVVLVLHGLAQLEGEHRKKQKERVFLRLSSCLKNWVSSHLSSLKNPKLAKAKEHIKVCLYVTSIQSLEGFYHVTFFCKALGFILSTGLPQRIAE